MTDLDLDAIQARIPDIGPDAPPALDPVIRAHDDLQALVDEVRRLRALVDDDAIVEYRVSSPNGLSGRGSAILNGGTYPHTREQAERALEAEKDFLRHDLMIREEAFRQKQIAAVTLQQRTVTSWSVIA